VHFSPRYIESNNLEIKGSLYRNSLYDHSLVIRHEKKYALSSHLSMSFFAVFWLVRSNERFRHIVSYREAQQNDMVVRLRCIVMNFGRVFTAVDTRKGISQYSLYLNLIDRTCRLFPGKEHWKIA
jgi:hypothetical protein